MVITPIVSDKLTTVEINLANDLECQIDHHLITQSANPIPDYVFPLPRGTSPAVIKELIQRYEKVQPGQKNCWRVTFHERGFATTTKPCLVFEIMSDHDLAEMRRTHQA